MFLGPISFLTFPDINRGNNGGQPPHFFGEDPSQYVDEVKQSLAGERGLSARNRDLVMEVLGRLADRVQSAENSRNAVVNELVSLRERFQVSLSRKVKCEFCSVSLYSENLKIFLSIFMLLKHNSGEKVAEK